MDKIDTIALNPIGIIYSPFNSIDRMPIQPLVAKGIKGRIIIKKEYVDGLLDLAAFSHITLIYYLHKSQGYQLRVTPFMDTTERGIFACRAPVRPNAIGLSTVRLLSIEGTTLHIEEVDIINETPLLDIKPFYPLFDNREDATSGWLTNIKNEPLSSLISDKRFI